MPDTSAQDTVSLDALRRDIDAADQEMHRLLIHRGEVIERLIAAKRLGPRGAAFRPDREAEMMRRLAARHSGRLPLSTVEHIWREIIGTFTQLQAPYRVHCAKADEPAMRDLLRFYFGFSTPLVGAGTNLRAVEAVARSGADLAVVALDDPLEERWWRAMSVPEGAPAGATGAKVIAVLPFLPLDSGLDLPRALVIGPADVEAPADFFLYAMEPGADIGATRRIVARGSAAVLAASRQPPAGDGLPCLGSFAAPADWPD